MKVFIRPLVETDAKTSFKWRNNPKVWRYTQTKPNRKITVEIEQTWLKEVMSRKNEKRFAICVGDEMEYVGNVQLTDITLDNAQFHIFIGELKHHGKGIGTKATMLILEYAFKELMLKNVYLYVNHKNVAAIKSYEKCDFVIVEKLDNDFKMIVINAE